MEEKTLRISWKILEDWGFVSVTDYCRHLVKNIPEDKLDFKIEIYREDMLCLTVPNIVASAQVMPAEGKGWVKYDPRRRSRRPIGASCSPADAFKCESGTNIALR